ncbi:hypothetical protein J2848_006105 [Azospirillum lipoferum]|uniref:Uncharacterized protein n=1 Tax=Azospirillum lipoferum TaxID=193 RepID=A0A5A9GDW6_AZOLI|nr:MULTISPECIES: hypothetical protein [Azospirillum]KAA0592606.1 hypothetical protein FZ942_27655 [Azospirillum lipoferum]MCP1614401.1 hypothetical protein [Azospirillum lipoferum]MDW5532767.1 hypothetical protein [Azospirillum sp. NL1]
MTLKEFKRYADAYGADLDRWPHSARIDALALLDDSAEARDLLVDAAVTDALLDAAPTPLVSARREARVYDRIADCLAQRVVPEFVPWFLSRPPFRPAPLAGFLAGMALAGFLSYSQGLISFEKTSTPSLSGVMIVSYLGDTR